MKNSFRVFGSGTGKAQPAALRNSPRLAEVNLRGESERDFDIDDEGPAYRPSVLTSIYVSIRRLMLGLALAAGGTYQYTRSRWEMAMGNGRGKKLLVVLLVISAIVIPVSIVLTKDNGSSSSGSNSTLSTERHSFISERILESGMSLEDELTTEGTPQNLALEWIVSGDHAQLAQDHDYLLQRYALAVFFYSTHGKFIQQPSEKDNETEEGAVEGHDDMTQGKENSSLAQPDWTNQNRWMSSYGICAWHGIQCHHRPGTDPLDNTFDDEGDIILFNLTDNNVRGFIPRELFVAHPYIRWISFSDNGLYGKLPTEIGFLDDLRYLSLSSNDLDGSLPSEIGLLTALSLLFVDGNDFLGRIPPEVGELTALGKLYICAFSIDFEMDINSLSFSLSLASAVDVSLYDNLLTGTIPTEFGLLQKVESLYFDVNHLIGTIPSELGAMKRLNDLRLRHNHFIGAIPSELANLERLEILYIDRNELTGTIPLELGGLSFLNELHLYGNKLKGSIPTELANLRSLVSLYLDNNHLTGGIPTEIGNIIDLQEIYIHKNYLNGTLPTELGKFSNLRNFRAYSNGLRGPIPSEIGNAWQIRKQRLLVLSVCEFGNQLTCFVSCFAQMTSTSTITC